ncbi:MAG: hypothetical protein P8Y53_15870 [Pseudolabrys sp.]
MRKLAIGLLAAAGVALAAPAGAQVVYQSVPAASGVVVAPSAGAYAYVVPQAPTEVYNYSNGDYSYNTYTYANGCHVTTIRDYG